jgi:MFS family permease
MDDTYRTLLARPGAARLLGGLVSASLSFGMVTLALFLTVHRAAGSYGPAGVAVAAFAAGAGALAPLRGRLLDRRGTQPWLIVFAAGHAAALLALAELARTAASPWPLVGLAAVGGASAPPLIASIRAAWPAVVEEPLVRRAYALTSVVGDVAAVAAPALAGLLFVALPWLPLVLAALGALVAALAAGGVARLPADPKPASAGPLFGRSFVVLLAVEAALGTALGLVEVAVPAAATRWGATAYSGVLLALFAGGSVLGGIWFGGRHWRAPADRRYLVAVLILAAALLPPIAATGAVSLAPLLLVAGLAYGPATISLFEALDELAPLRATEAFTWITTAAAAGTAAGSAAAGWATTGIGLWSAFAAASALLGSAALAGLASRGRRLELQPLEQRE